MIPDAHCHLADLEDADEALREARAAGVGPIVAVAMSPRDADVALDLRRRHPDLVLAGAGLHPSRVPEITDAEAEAELDLLARRSMEADVIGEIGLDYKDAVDETQRRRQRDILDRALAVAAAARKPANLHTRRADRDLLGMATSFTRGTGLPALLHWFTHSKDLAAECARAGLYISVGPSILSDARQAEVARRIDGDLLLVETDSPVIYVGEAARPAWARRVAQKLADLRGEPLEDTSRRLVRNMGRYLGREITPSGARPPA
jgi:TatD DNase family protein